MNNAAEAERARRGRALGAPRQSGASRGSASRVPLPGGGGVPLTSGAVPRSRRRNKSPGAPRPPRAAGGLTPRVAAPALPSRGPAGGRPRSPRLSAPASPGTPLPPRRRAEGGAEPLGQGARGAALSAPGGAVCLPRRPLAAGQEALRGRPALLAGDAARSAAGAVTAPQYGGRRRRSDFPPYQMWLLRTHCACAARAGGHARRAARSRCPEGRGGGGCEGLPRGTGTAWGARLLAAGNGAPVRGRRGERFPYETAGPSVRVARPSARSGGAGARGPRAAQPSAALPVS